MHKCFSFTVSVSSIFDKGIILFKFIIFQFSHLVTDFILFMFVFNNLRGHCYNRSMTKMSESCIKKNSLRTHLKRWRGIGRSSVVFCIWGTTYNK